MKIVLTAALYGLFFIIVEVIIRRTKLSKEVSRKTVHILFIPVMLLSKRFNLLSSVHKVQRRTYGEVYFPVAILITALVFPERPLYMYGLLIMALSDGFASVIGQRYGRHRYRLMFGQKSYEGSSIFFLLSMVIGLIILLVFGTTLLPALILSTTMALILTLVEASLSFGLDNLVLPPLASGLMLVLTGLLGL
jgi:phytol kinase